MTDIVERLRVKWDSIGDMANAERDEAAYAIISLRNECAIKVAHIAELKAQVRTIALERDEARERFGRIIAGLEGFCITCEPVNVRNQQMEREIATLKAERDEARLEVCQLLAQFPGSGASEGYAEERGWQYLNARNDGKS